MQRRRWPYLPVIDWPQLAHGFQSSRRAVRRSGRASTRAGELAAHGAIESTGGLATVAVERGDFDTRRLLYDWRGLQLAGHEPANREQLPNVELRQHAAGTGNTKPVVRETVIADGREIEQIIPRYDKARGGRGRIW